MNVEKFLNTGEYFIHHNETISIAESVTGGLLQGIFASMENAEKFFQGGITAYNIGQKVKHLQVEPIHAAKCNCVSEEVAIKMALGACAMFNSNWGIGITGYATPVDASGHKVFAFFAIVKNSNVALAKKIPASIDDPSKVKEVYIEAVLKGLQKLIIPENITR